MKSKFLNSILLCAISLTTFLTSSCSFFDDDTSISDSNVNQHVDKNRQIITTGQGEPSKEGQDGDIYIDTETWNVYKSNGLAWFNIGNIKGEKGEPGKPGDKGDPGTNGTNGQDGADGKDGKDGQDGKSAYELYCEAHPEYKENEKQWIDDLINGNLYTQNSHTVKFETYGSTISFPDIKVKHGEKIPKPSISPDKSGYKFEYWSYQDEPWSFIGYVCTEDMTLEANYSVLTYQVTIDYDNGEPQNIKTVSPGQIINLSTPSYIGHKFIKWINALDGSEIKSPYKVQSNVVIKAIWGTRVDLQFNCNGGTDVDQVDLYTNEICEELPIPKKNDFSFAGWYIDDKTLLEVPFEVNSDTYQINLVAHWKDAAIDYDFLDINVNELEISKYKGTDSFINIPDFYKGKKITSIGQEAFMNHNEIKKIFLPDNITEIKDNGFARCRNLTYINCPESLKVLGANALQNCESLKSFILNTTIEDLDISAFTFVELSFLYLPLSLRKIRNLNESFYRYTPAIYYEGSFNQFKTQGFSNGFTSEYIAKETITYEVSLKSYRDVVENDYEYTIINDKYITITKYKGNEKIVDIGSNVNFSSKIIIGITRNAFYGLEKVETITIPGTVISVCSYFIDNLKNLKKIVFNPGFKVLGELALASISIHNCNIFLPFSLIYIGKGAFWTNGNNSINYAGNELDFSRIALGQDVDKDLQEMKRYIHYNVSY